MFSDEYLVTLSVDPSERMPMDPRVHWKRTMTAHEAVLADLPAILVTVVIMDLAQGTAVLAALGVGMAGMVVVQVVLADPVEVQADLVDTVAAQADVQVDLVVPVEDLVAVAD